MKGIKNIILDLGGVLYDLNYEATQDKLAALGCQRDYSKLNQGDWYDQIEEGKISGEEFLKGLQNLSVNVPKPSIEELKEAWNLMLLGVKKDKLTLLNTLKSKYRLFLYSNTNEIHIEAVWGHFKQVHQLDDLSSFFEEVYLSNEMGIRKPKPEGFIQIVEEQGLVKSETLFIDDSPQHVEGAKKAGIHALWLDVDAQDLKGLLVENSLL